MEPTSSPAGNPEPKPPTPPSEPPKPRTPIVISPTEPVKPISDEKPGLDPGIPQTIKPSGDRPAPLPPFSPSGSPSSSSSAGADTGISPAASTPVSPAGPQPGGPSTPITPASSEPSTPYQPTIMVGSDVPPSSGSVNQTSPTGRRFSKKLLIPIIAAVVLIGGASAYYFGYYNNPSVIYSQSLEKTGKGYDKLIDYADKESKQAKSYTGTGTYKISSDGTTVDGDIGYKAGSGASQLTFDVGASGVRVNVDVRTFKSDTSVTPDFYFKVGGLKGLGTSLGQPDLEPYLDQLDNTWIVIDHTFYDSLSSGTSQSGGLTSPTHDQVIDEARAFGKVNQDYVFTTDKNKAITTVLQKYGKETVNGHKTYHYKIALQKDNVKKYILAQRDALKASKLNDWLKANKADQDIYKSLTDSADSAKNIKSSDTYDIWVDTGQRIVYKIRFPDSKDPAVNYADVGLDYKGGDSFPFFISGKSTSDSDTTTYDLGATLNTKTNKVNFNADVKASGQQSETFTADFGLQSSTGNTTIDKPANAKPISQVLNDLGLGGLVSGTDTSSSSSASAATQLRSLTNGQSKPNSANAVQNVLLRRLLGQ